jgi:putative transcription factor
MILNPNMQCEMCGKETEPIRAIIEGSELKVCQACAGFGIILKDTPKPIARPNPFAAQKPALTKPLPNDSPQFYLAVMDDYASRIKNKRDSMCIKQEDLAKMLNEKESLIQKIESGHFKPNLELARKFESFLKITLVEQRKEEDVSPQSNNRDCLTIGDLMALKKRF